MAFVTFISNQVRMHSFEPLLRILDPHIVWRYTDDFIADTSAAVMSRRFFLWFTRDGPMLTKNLHQALLRISHVSAEDDSETTCLDVLL